MSDAHEAKPTVIATRTGDRVRIRAEFGPVTLPEGLKFSLPPPGEIPFADAHEALVEKVARIIVGAYEGSANEAARAVLALVAEELRERQDFHRRILVDLLAGLPRRLPPVAAPDGRLLMYVDPTPARTLEAVYNAVDKACTALSASPLVKEG